MMNKHRLLLKALVHLKCATSEEVGRFEKEYREGEKKKESLSFIQFLLKNQHFTQKQIQQALSLLDQGYYHCSSCGVVYPLPSGENPLSRPCPQCHKVLEIFRLSGGATPLTGSTFSTGEEGPSTLGLEEIQKGMESRPPREFKRVDTPRYPILKTLGKGGYGHVYQVKDSLTGRKMALKVLKMGTDRKIKVKKRFLREIQITAQLEHPGIMPVYESGYLEGGRLYFIMKELKGGTLKDLINLRKSKREDAPSLREMLEILIKVCEALEYAHSRGIIHRDLKPSNIAVGNFGEVMILDWGIARALGVDEPESGGLEEETGEVEVEGQTLTMGGILGTPGFMSPEQAKGQEITPRSDIHAMGAILYQILTFRPPYQGKPSSMVIKVLTEDPLPPHEKFPELDIPLELSAMAMKCLKKDPCHRYQSVGQLREDILRYLKGFSVSARRDPLRVAAVKWVRRNKALAGAVVLALLAVVISLVITRAIEKGKREDKISSFQREATKILSTSKIVTAGDLEEKFPRIYSGNRRETMEARRVRQGALRSYMKARKKLEKALELAKGNDRLENKLFQVEEAIGQLALLGGDYLLAETSFERCLKLDAQRGKKLMQLLERRKKEAQKSQLQRLAAIMKALGARPPAPGMIDEYITEIVRMAEPKIVKRLLTYIDREKVWQRKVAITALGKMGDRHTRYQGKDVVEWLINRLESLSVKKNREECRWLVWALGRLRDKRANQVVEKKRLKMGRKSNFWNQTKVPFSWIPEEKEKETKTVLKWFKSGSRKLNKGQFKEAIGDFTRAIQKQPQYSEAYISRGLAYYNLKDYSKAIQDYTKAIEINPDNQSAYNNRGFAYNDSGQYKKALQDCTEAIRLEPRNLFSYNNRGNVYYRLKKYKEAIQDYTKAIQLNSQYAVSYNNRGNAYNHIREYKKALDDLNRAIKLNPSYAKAYSNRGRAYEGLKKYKKAIDNYTKALEINPRSVNAYFYRAMIYRRLREYEKSHRDFSHVIDLSPKYAEAYTFRGIVLKHLKKYGQALRDFNRALELNPKDGIAYFNRAMVYKFTKKYREAIDDLTGVIRINSRYANGYYHRGYIYYILEEYKKAIQDYTKAIQLRPRHGIYYLQRGYSWKKLKKYGQAAKDFKKFLKFHPRHPRADSLRKFIDKHR